MQPSRCFENEHNKLAAFVSGKAKSDNFFKLSSIPTVGLIHNFVQNSH